MTGNRKRGALKGSRRVKRLINRLPDDVKLEMVETLNRAGPIIAGYAKAAAPKKTGALSRAIKWKVSPKSLTLRVGLLTKAVARDLFYGRILEFGRKAKTVTVRRGARKVSRRRVVASNQTYTMRVRAISAKTYDFVAGRTFSLARQTLRPDLAKIWERALKRASGVGDE